MSERGTSIAVLVSGTGTNLRALRRAERDGVLGGAIALVLADRPCAAVEFAAGEGIETLVLPVDPHRDRAAWDTAIADALERARVALVVLAGFMRVLGAPVLERFAGRIVNVHPSLLPAFPGTRALDEAIAAGVRVTGVTVHLVDSTLDGGPILLQEAVVVAPGESRPVLEERIHAVEHRLLPRAVALILGGAVRVDRDAVALDPTRAAGVPTRRRALVSVSDKRGLGELGRGLAELGFELVSTGGTARALRDAGVAVTDVATVTGFPEMLDGRVKTLHPRVAAGVLADRRLEAHRAQLAAAGIEPFDLVVVNLYPFAAAAAREGVSTDELIEEIDIGGPTLVRAAAKNHASVAIVTDPDRYRDVLHELRRDGRLAEATRRRLAAGAFAHTAAYDAHIARILPARLGLAVDDGDGSFPASLPLAASRTRMLRYGENPHQRAALYVLSGADPAAGPFAGEPCLLQGRELSYNNILDASAAAGIARDLRGAACVVVKHTNPCGAAEAEDLTDAWQAALAGDPVSAFGGVVAVRGVVDAALAEGLASLFLEVVVAAGFRDDALTVLSAKPNLRLVVDPGICTPPRPALEVRSAGGGLLATDADVAADDPATWRLVTSRAPSEHERRDLDLAWRVCRHVKSNAIVLARDGAIVGVGAGQMSRVDSARLAVEKAGPDRATGAVCASDAFFPFPDGVEACLAAGVRAFVQPGGSQRDAEVIAVAERAGGSMLVTGTRHFRH